MSKKELGKVTFP